MIFCKITNKNVIKATHSSGIWKKVAKSVLKQWKKVVILQLLLWVKVTKKALKQRNIATVSEIVIIFAAKKGKRKTL